MADASLAGYRHVVENHFPIGITLTAGGRLYTGTWVPIKQWRDWVAEVLVRTAAGDNPPMDAKIPSLTEEQREEATAYSDVPREDAEATPDENFPIPLRNARVLIGEETGWIEHSFIVLRSTSVEAVMLGKH